MSKDYRQIDWNDELADDCRQIVRLAVREDLDRGHDLTTLALVSRDAISSAAIVSRSNGVVAGLRACEMVLDDTDTELSFHPQVEDGARIDINTCLAEISGAARQLLTIERLLLNFLGRMSGVATLTRLYVDAVASVPGATAKIYDTRKTIPGWRRLDKYAVRCGGGMNHRTGLYDAVLIKDNHLALLRDEKGEEGSPSRAVQLARNFVEQSTGQMENVLIEIEVDTLDQLRDALNAKPDIVLLDNMSPDQLRQACLIRDEVDAHVELEASGGVTLETVKEIAKSGVDRISVGALTHSAVALDFGMDWR